MNIGLILFALSIAHSLTFLLVSSFRKRGLLNEVPDELFQGWKNHSLKMTLVLAILGIALLRVQL